MLEDKQVQLQPSLLMPHSKGSRAGLYSCWRLPGIAAVGLRALNRSIVEAQQRLIHQQDLLFSPFCLKAKVAC